MNVAQTLCTYIFHHEARKFSWNDLLHSSVMDWITIYVEIVHQFWKKSFNLQRVGNSN